MLSTLCCLITVGIFLDKCDCLAISPKNTNDKSYQQIQNILTNALGANIHGNQNDSESVFPWKKSTAVLEYHNILHFNDESVILHAGN